MSTHSPKVLGAGLVALDLVVSSDPDAAIQAWAGGTCGNVLAILAWHGWDAFPIARMNGDAASLRVQSDLVRWGIKLDLAECAPVANTPIVVQEIRRNRAGAATHRFTWACLRCGGWLPSFKPVTRAAVETVRPYLAGSSVFFLDRVSRGTVDLAKEAAEAGAIVMFEPSGRGDEKLFSEALEIAHIVKYAAQRINQLAETAPSSNRLLEIQTLGANGLRYRLPNKGQHATWREMEAVPVEVITDSCGSGDWCTAGLLAHLGASGIDGLRSMSLESISEGLMYGQELAAWNCGFEGARGGMYQDETPPIRRRARNTPGEVQINQPSTQLVECPKCDVA